MATYEMRTPEPISVTLELGVGDVRFVASDGPTPSSRSARATKPTSPT